MYWAPVVPMWFSTSSSKIGEVPELKWVIMYLPTRPFEFASPLVCLSVAEFSRMHGFCAAHAASTTTMASWTWRSFFWS